MPGHKKKTYKVAKKGTTTASEKQMLVPNMPGGGKAPMYMMGGKVFEGAMGLMTALAKKNPKDFKKVAEGIK